MKKILYILAIVIYSISSFAQKEHLKFMDIPINGSINSFQKKLIKKGIIPDSQKNSGESSVRWFKGDFYGYDADIIVFFDKYTHIVYMARAIITREDSIVCNDIYKMFKERLEKKYGKPLATRIPDNTPTFLIMKQGRIDCFPKCFKFNDSFPAKYSVFIEYEDVCNSIKHRESVDNDL